MLISEYVIVQIATYFAVQIPGITRVNRVVVNMKEEGVTIRLEVTARYNTFLPDLAKKVQADVQQHIEYLTGLIVYGVHVFFKSLDY